MGLMRVAWFTWKDFLHPKAGGAEIITHELTKRLAGLGHQVFVFTSRYQCSLAEEVIDNITYVRRGNRFTVYWHAWRWYRKHDFGFFDLVVDEVNTVPFFTPWFVRSRRIVFIHQLARIVWFYEASLPLAIIGWLIEPIMLQFYRNTPAVTISSSTALDLQRFGLKSVSVIREGVMVDSVTPVPPGANIDVSRSAFLAFGAIRPMKRQIHILRAFAQVAERESGAQLWIAGVVHNRKYEMRLREHIRFFGLEDRVRIFGSVDTAGKIWLMKHAYALVTASVREGWCLVVTEGNRVGLPCVGYDVHGLRDAIIHNKTGLLCKSGSPSMLAAVMHSMIRSPEMRDRYAREAQQFSQQFTFEGCFNDFMKTLDRFGLLNV